MEITVDGVAYGPRGSAGPQVGIAITTHNRASVLATALEHHRRHLPADAHVVVVDDGSDTPVKEADWYHVSRSTEARGIVAAKNASLIALMDAGCEHLFLWDDDGWPTAADWHLPYLNSPEPHLAYQFLDLATNRKLNDIAITHQDAEHVAYTGQRGVMLYYRRSAIETCGGFDPVYGRGLYEHSDLALRIHRAGLTTWPFADVAGSGMWVHSMDEHEEVERSIPDRQRQQLAAANAKVHNLRRDHPETAPTYVPYQPQRDAVVTTLLTTNTDTQRNKTWKPDPTILDDWAASIIDADAVVLADQLTDHPKAEVVQVEPVKQGNPYRDRWMYLYRYLRERPEIRYVFATDGSDVTMLRTPWRDLETGGSGKLYVGWEPTILGCPWMRQHYTGPAYEQLWADHGHEQLHNAGIIGGSRHLLMRFAHQMVDHFHTQASRQFWEKPDTLGERDDMGAFNLLTHSPQWSDRIVTGPWVATVFKADEANAWSMWKHK